MSEIFARIRRNHKIVPFFVANFFIAIHYIVVIYVNSSFLKSFFSEKGVSILYTVAAILSVAFFLIAPRIIRRLSNFNFLLVIFALESLSLLALVFAPSKIVVALAFLMYFATVYAIFYSMDVFLETAIKNEGTTGVLRGIYLTIANVGVILGPSIVSLIIKDNDYSKVYIVAILALIPAAIIAYKYFRNVGEPVVSRVNLKEDVEDLRRYPDIKRITAVNFVLQFFFAWMVVYTPLYLHEVIGIPWSKLGFVFSVMLLPFVLFDFPVGKLADSRWGEKEVLIGGLIIMALSTIFVAIFPFAIVWMWAVILFITRVGASVVEISSDSYFFKQVTGNNANLISIYRSMSPFSYILAPFVFFLASNITGLRYSFIILALVVVLALFPALKIKDTK